ncbi:MAG: lysyl oxidase family protein [Actinomycetota bacterium]|nr:lysyl oxidase family protein [Actinomycetota bacterium]
MRTRLLRARILVIACGVAILSGTIAPGVLPASAKEITKFVGRLSAGDELFWDGPYVDKAGMDHWWWVAQIPESYIDYVTGEPYGCDEVCWRYELEVTEEADRLRIALDYPADQKLADYFYFDVYRPDGEHAAYGEGYLSQEAFIKNPEPGKWRVVVEAWHATDTTFRMRAKLENEKPEPAKRVLLAPNLRISPPQHFTFRTPPHWVLPWDDAYPYASCTPDEVTDDQSLSCMRLTVGIENTGRGPLQLMYSSIVDEGAKMYQQLLYSDGTTKMREAGTYEYHETHQHYHFAGFAKLDLLRVTDPGKGELEHAAIGHKVGFCLGDAVFAEWFRFAQAPYRDVRSDCDAPQQAWMGLTVGWTDLYAWFQAGNYVEWPGGDGLYVVRAMADAQRTLVETNEKDNWGYAYLRVEGDDITVLERGHGKDPWDPNKEVVLPWWEQTR